MFHNQNGLTAAAKAGDLDVEPVEVVAIHSAYAFLRDVRAGAIFAVETSFLDRVCAEERRERFMTSPYGNLVDVGPALDAAEAASSPAATAYAVDTRGSTTTLTPPVDAAGVVIERDGRRHALEAAPDLEEVPLTAVELDLPTGDLLMTDYLRAGEASEGDRDTPFTKAIDLGEGGCTRFDLGSTLGRARRSVAHAERHAMGFVQTTNTGVVVHRHPASGVVMASEPYRSDEVEDDDGDAVCAGWEKLGTFSCDVWRITTLDRSSAVALMGAGGDPDAAATLDAYLASDDRYARNVMRASVSPGRYRLHAGESFHERVDRAAFAIPDGIEPWMLLEPVR